MAVDGGVTLAAGPYAATVRPDVGMLVTSITHEGHELVSLHGGVDAYRAGHTTGVPLLYPWANRLSGFAYRVAGVDVTFGDEPPVHVMAGLPIHGTMAGASGWEVDEASSTPGQVVTARFTFAADRPQFVSFPFPHTLEVGVAVAVDGVSVTTAVHADAGADVPVSFGWHPYFQLPRVEREDVAVVLPPREHLGLDARMLPTGAATHEPSSVHVLGVGEHATTFDDAYRLSDVVGQRVLAIEGGGHRVAIELDEHYPYAQVYAPADHAFVALEPMTAPIDALVSGDHPVAAAGTTFQATFTVRADDFPS